MVRSWLALATVCVILMGCAPSSGPAGASTPSKAPSGGQQANELAKKFAPLVRLGEGEKYQPIDAGVFIDNSELRWNRDGCPDEQIDADPTAQKLADPASYRAQKTTDKVPRLCRKSGPEYNTTQRTRPFDNDELGTEGYFLDALNDVHEQGSTGAPVYVEYVEGKDANAGKTAYVYWFFYPWNRWTNPAGGHGGNHEGDWERITVVAEGSRPVGVVFSQHLTKCRVEWDDVVGADGHPVVYSALGSHGSYPVGDARYRIDNIPDIGALDDRTSTNGPQWRTWNNVKEIRAEPWWKYAGGWGEIGGTPSNFFKKLQTGPAGPSPYKDMNGEVFTTAACPPPEPKEEPKPSEEPKPEPTVTPKTKAAAIERFEAYLHAVGKEDIDTVCEIVGPAAKKAEKDGFGPCKVTFRIYFELIGKENRHALLDATVDPDQVSKVSAERYEIPASAIRSERTFTSSDLGDHTLDYLDDNWFITD